MTVYYLILLALLLFSIFWIVILAIKNRDNLDKARTATAELYKTKTDISAKNKIFELNKSIYGAHQKNLRKSPVLTAAEHVK